MPDAATARLRVRGGEGGTFAARLTAARPAAVSELPSPALSAEAGGTIPARHDPRGQVIATERIYEVQVRPVAGAEAPPLVHGVRVEARIPLPPEPLAIQLWTSMRQLFQRRLAV